MIKGFLNIPYFVWSTFSLILGIVWVYVGPHTKMTAASGFRYFVIRWGHVLTGLFLAVSFFLRGLGPALNGGSSFFALAGGLMYLLFIAIMFIPL